MFTPSISHSDWPRITASCSLTEGASRLPTGRCAYPWRICPTKHTRTSDVAFGLLLGVIETHTRRRRADTSRRQPNSSCGLAVHESDSSCRRECGRDLCLPGGVANVILAVLRPSLSV